MKNFKEYVDLYIKDKVDDSGQALKIAYEQVNDRWEVAVTLSDKGFQQVSFVNSIATTKVKGQYNRLLYYCEILVSLKVRLESFFNDIVDSVKVMLLLGFRADVMWTTSLIRWSRSY